MLESDPELEEEELKDRLEAGLEIEEGTELLPEEWCDKFQSLDMENQLGQTDTNQQKVQGRHEVEVMKCKKQKWGPIVPERRSTRLKDCGPVLEKA